MKVMMQAVWCPWRSHYSLSLCVSVAFHYIILKDSCLPPHKYVPLTPIGVSSINAPLRLGCRARCLGKSILKWMKWGASWRVNGSSRSVKDTQDGGHWFRMFQMFRAENIMFVSMQLQHTQQKYHSMTLSDQRGNRKIPCLTKGLFSLTPHSHTTSAPNCINKLQASSGKQTFLLEAPATGRHMCLLR